MADTPVCGWNGCTRLERSTAAVVGELHATSSLRHTQVALRGRSWFKRRLAELGCELAGVCQECASEIVKLVILDMPAVSCGHRQRELPELVEALRGFVAEAAGRLEAFTAQDRRILRACTFQVAFELHVYCIECARSVVADVELGGGRTYVH